MEIITVLVLVFIAYAYIDKEIKKGKRAVNKINKTLGIKTPSKKSMTTFTPMSEDEKEKQAEEIAEKVKTLSGIEALETRFDKLEEKYQYEEDEIKAEKIEEQMDILRTAIDIAYDKPYRYYYFDDPDTDTELEELKLIGKLITPEKYNEFDKYLQDKFDFVTFYEVDDAKETAEECLTDEVKELIKFRKIVESELPEEEKAKKFNRLVSKSEYLLDELELDSEPEMEEYDNEFDASLYGQYIQRFK